MTPLHMAAEGGRFYFVKRFADHEADINIKDNSGVNMILLLIEVSNVLAAFSNQLRRTLYHYA